MIFYKERCCKWSNIHRETTNWVENITIVILGVILGVILRVVLVILLEEMVMRGDFYKES